MTRRQWYVVIVITISLLWGLSLVVVFGLRLGPIDLSSLGHPVPCRVSGSTFSRPGD